MRGLTIRTKCTGFLNKVPEAWWTHILLEAKRLNDSSRARRLSLFIFKKININLIVLEDMAKIWWIQTVTRTTCRKRMQRTAPKYLNISIFFIFLHSNKCPCFISLQGSHRLHSGFETVPRLINLVTTSVESTTFTSETWLSRQRCGMCFSQVRRAECDLGYHIQHVQDADVKKRIQTKAVMEHPYR